MKRVILKYGGAGVATMVVLFFISFLFIEKDGVSLAVQEMFGYLSIVASLVFVFFGIRSYRDNELNGNIGFLKALGLGMLIALIPAILFGLYNVIYVLYINPEFVDEYYAIMYNDLANHYTGSELIAKQEEMESQKEMFSLPFFNFMIMTMTVLVIGFIISLISAMVLKRKA